MTEEVKNQLQKYADKFETESFCKEDPSEFIRWYKLSADSVADVEFSSFIAAMLSFGSRKQFIPKIRSILNQSDEESGSISKWINKGTYKTTFPAGEKKFYRFYSYNDMQVLFDELQIVLKQYGELGLAVKSIIDSSAEKNDIPDEINIVEICSAFAKLFKNSKIVPKGKNSANKRIHMFLRWMVRDNSPVDIGIWNWISKDKLIIPLDVHVMEESIKLGLLPENAQPVFKTAVLLTKQLEEVFPGDPVRGDFALFGVGVNS